MPSTCGDGLAPRAARCVGGPLVDAVGRCTLVGRWVANLGAPLWRRCKNGTKLAYVKAGVQARSTVRHRA